MDQILEKLVQRIFILVKFVLKRNWKMLNNFGDGVAATFSANKFLYYYFKGALYDILKTFFGLARKNLLFLLVFRLRETIIPTPIMAQAKKCFYKTLIFKHN
jgi:hypothetical protein